jgi:molybdate transport system ATP-binding protein
MIELDVRLPLARFRLDVHAAFTGTSVAVLGPSGSGKTSLLEAIAGLRPGCQGHIVLVGELLLDSASGTRLAPERRRIGYVPQDALLFPHLDVERNVRFGLAAGPDSDRLFAEAVEILEIGPLLLRYPATLSGGERQRVALARALATRPRLLLLDEPLAAVDAQHRERILPYLLSVRDSLRIPFLYVTHNAGEAEIVAQEALLLRGGQVEAHGPTAAVLRGRTFAAADPLAAFENVFDGMLEPAGPGTGEAHLRLKAGGTLVVPAASASGRAVYAVLPEDVLLSADPLPRVSARNVFEGVVESVDSSGENVMVRLRAAGASWRALVTAAAAKDLGIAAGRRVWLAVKAQAFRPLR